MKKYFFTVLLSIIFVTLLLSLRPKPKTTLDTKQLPTATPSEVVSLKAQNYTNQKHFYQYSCPQGSTRSIELSSGDGTVMPYFQETCHLENNQVRIYVYSISFYDRLKKDPSITIENYSESSLQGFKTITYTAKNEADYYEIFLSPSKIITLRGFDKRYFDFVKNSFSIVNYPTPTPKIVPDVAILDTASWSTHTCEKLTFKSPPKFSVLCNPNSTVSISNNDQVAMILQKKYNGGSRKQYWLDQLNLSPNDIQKLTHSVENKFGEVSGLDFFADGYESPILINSGNTIIIILGGRGYDSNNKVATRWDVTDTIASTIKLYD